MCPHSLCVHPFSFLSDMTQGLSSSMCVRLGRLIVFRAGLGSLSPITSAWYIARCGPLVPHFFLFLADASPKSCECGHPLKFAELFFSFRATR